MAGMFIKYFSLLQIFCFFLFLTFNNISSSISSNISTKCFRRTYYAVQATRTPRSPQCDAGQSSNVREVSETLDYSLHKVEQYKRLPRIDPVKVGYTRQVKHDGKTYTLKTLSVRPPIFEIQNFLSSDECDHIVQMAMSTGMATSATIWSEYDEVLADGNLRAVFERLDVNNDNSLDYIELGDGIQGIKDIQVEREDLKEMLQNFDLDFLEDDKVTFKEFEVLTSPEVLEEIKSYLGKLERRKSSVKMRQSFSAFLDSRSSDDRQKEFFKKLYLRISKVTQLPIEMIRSSEELQIIKYEVGGHYHGHLDSEGSDYAPCCHLLQSTEDLCRPCRYATMFYYLNEPLEGGGTAFPFADNVTYDDELYANICTYQGALHLTRSATTATRFVLFAPNSVLFASATIGNFRFDYGYENDYRYVILSREFYYCEQVIALPLTLCIIKTTVEPKQPETDFQILLLGGAKNSGGVQAKSIKQTIRDEKHRLNLSSHCDKANLVYLPKKGAALFWYNHVIDDDTGWMGKLDEMSTHGGCDVIQGEKWGANNWLNADIHREADLEIWKKFTDPS